VAKLEVSLSDNTLYFGDSGASGEFMLSMVNDGQTDITIEGISSDYEWAQSRNLENTPFIIPVGSRSDIPVRISINEPNGYYTCSIHIKANAGSWDMSINVLPKPRIAMYIDDLARIEMGCPQEQNTKSIIRPAKSGREKWNCYLEIIESSLTVESIRIYSSVDSQEPQYINVETLKDPFNLDPAGTRRVNFILDIDVPNLPKENRYALSINCSRISSPIVGEFTIKHLLEPKIDISSLFTKGLSEKPEVISIRAWEDKLKLPDEFFVRSEDDFEVIPIEMINSGDIAVRLVSCKIDNQWMELASDLPVILEPGKIEAISIKLNTGSFLNDLISPITRSGSVSLSFECTDFDYAIPSKTIELIANIAMMPEYEGIVAIDFGTTNSCCAVESGTPAQPSEMAPLDGSPMLPSVIYYINDDEKKGYIVGQRALTFSRMPDTNPSTVRSIKRRLGQRERVPVILDETKRQIDFLPEEITGHIVKEIIDNAEKHLNRRITRCVVTHPARFFRPQIMALERAFQEECGVEIAALVNEAVAAAFDAILNQDKSANPEYTIIVYDFGGGTTDIALIRVRDSVDAEGIREIAPETLGVDGKRRLGGDDVTEKLISLILEKCENELSQTEGLKLIWTDDTQFRSDASANLVRVLSIADEHKKQLADGGDPGLPLLPLACMRDGDIEMHTFQISVTENEMNQLIEDSIRDAMKLAYELVDRANERDSLNIKYPDIVVLAGMSSRLPVVKKIAEEMFPNSDVRLHSDLKACVARGAYMIHSISQWPAMISVDTTFLKNPPPTSAQYGIMVYGIHGEPVFKGAIPKGSRLPAEGVIGGFRIGRKTAITVYENPGRNISDPEIRKIAVCRLNIPESISEQDLRKAQVSMRLEDEMNLKIVLKVGSKDYEFDAEVEPYI